MSQHELKLKPDEMAYLAASNECVSCGHLVALHNGHCCIFCLVCEENCRKGTQKTACDGIDLWPGRPRNNTQGSTPAR